MNRNATRSSLLIIVILIHLFMPTACEPLLRRSCGAELIERVATICYERGGYNRMEYMRRKRNIIQECCQKPCTDKALDAYCFEYTPEKNDVEVDIVP